MGLHLFGLFRLCRLKHFISINFTHLIYSIIR